MKLFTSSSFKNPWHCCLVIPRWSCLTIWALSAILNLRGVSAKLVLDGNKFRTEPANFGRKLSTTKAEKARLQFIRSDPALCDRDAFNATKPVVSPMDGLPVALLVKDDVSCLDGETASIASLDPNVGYLIFFDPDLSATREGSTMISDYETDMGIFFVSGVSGATLLEAIESQSDESLSSGGPVIQLDGSMDKEYIMGRKVIIIVSKISGFLSMAGSIYIIYNIVGTRANRNKKLSLTFHRLILMLSFCDIFSSVAFFMTTWMVPKETDGSMMQYAWDVEFPFAAGTQGTCTFQGFLIQFGYTGSALSTAFLSLHYVLIVRYNWREQRMKKAEKVFFVFGLLFPFVAAVGLAFGGVMNPVTGGVCWINNYPYTCWDHPEPFCHEREDKDEDLIWNLRMFMGMLWIVLSLVVVIVSMAVLFATVRFQEKRMRRFSDAAAEGRRQRQVMNKAFLYIGAFLIAWIPTFLRQFEVLPSSIASDFFVSLTLPLQGFLNAIIYSERYKAIGTFLGSTVRTFKSRFFSTTDLASSKGDSAKISNNSSSQVKIVAEQASSGNIDVTAEDTTLNTRPNQWSTSDLEMEEEESSTVSSQQVASPPEDIYHIPADDNNT